MSTEAIGWAKRQPVPCAGTNSVLRALADYANAAGFAWPAVATLARDTYMSERTVQRMLKKLDDARVLIRCDVVDRHNGRTRSTAYFFPLEGRGPTAKELRNYELEVGGRVTQVSPWEGVNLSPSEGVNLSPREGDTGVTGRVTLLSPLKEPNSNLSDADASSTGVRVSANDVRRVVEAIWAVYPAYGKRTSSKSALSEPIAGLLGEGVAGDRLIASAVAYAADKSAWGATGKPKNCAGFYAEGRWENFGAAADGVGLGEGPADLFGFDGPAQVRAAVVAAESDDFAKAYLDPSTWRPGDAAVITHTRMAAERLKAIFSKLERAGVRDVVWKGAA